MIVQTVNETAHPKVNLKKKTFNVRPNTTRKQALPLPQLIRVPDARDREFFIDNLLVPIHFIIVMIRWTGLAPWEFEFPFPGSLAFTFLGS